MIEVTPPSGAALSEDPSAHQHYGDDLKPGSLLLDGIYRIEGFLNAGGFGITYLARDSIDRTVVVKECFPGAVCRRVGTTVRPRSRKYAAAFKTFVQNFLDEAKALARIKHPNIVGVHQVFEDNGTAYMVIDFIDGKDLQHILATSGTAFSPVAVVDLLGQMLSAVDFIHKLGILHRDIAPDNILIDPSGKPVLIDFGEASEDLTPHSRIVTERHVVKEGYSPHELYLTGAEQTAASDLYALAATFYHMISGHAPPSSQRRLAALAGGDPDPCQPLEGRYRGYPPGFLAAVDAALRLFPKDRLQSAGDWIASVQNNQTLSNPEPIAAFGLPSPVMAGAAGPFTERFGRFARLLTGRQWIYLAAAAVLLAGMLTGRWVTKG